VSGVSKTFALLLALGLGVVLLAYGTHEEGVRQVIRWTARSSFCLLCLALAGEGVKGTSFGWRQRADLLRGLAMSHGLHAVAILALAWYTSGGNLMERASVVNVLGGAFAYAMIFWGAFRPFSGVTSFGLFWIWGVFLVGYGTRAMRMPWPYGLAVALLAAALLVRVLGASALSRARSKEEALCRS
jgi:hypothetical protein